MFLSQKHLTRLILSISLIAEQVSFIKSIDLARLESLNNRLIEQKNKKKRNCLTFSYSAWASSNLPRETPWIMGN